MLTPTGECPNRSAREQQGKRRNTRRARRVPGARHYRGQGASPCPERRTTSAAGIRGKAEKTGGGSKAVPRTVHPLHPSNLNVSSRKMNQSPSLRDGNHPFFLQDAGKWRAYGTILAAMTHSKAVTEVHHLLPIITPPISPSLSASTLVLLVWCLISESNFYPKGCELFVGRF